MTPETRVQRSAIQIRIASGLGVKQLVRRVGAACARLLPPGRHLAFWIIAWVAIAGAQVLAIAPVIFGGEQPAPASDILERLIGGSFASCGLLAWHRRPGNRIGRLLVATGLAFFIYPLFSQVDSPLIHSLALLLGNLAAIPFVVLLLSFPTGRRLQSSLERGLIGGFVLALLILQFVWMLFLPQPDNLLLAWASQQLSGAIDKAQRSLAFGLSLALFLLLAARWAHATRPLRLALLPSIAGSVTLFLYAALLLNDLVTGSRSELLLLLVDASLFTVPLAFLVGLLRSRLARAAVADLMPELRTARRGRLQAALARALGDPSLQLAYWLPEYHTYVDAGGEPVSLPRHSGERVTKAVEHDGEHVATLIYDASLAEEEELVDAVCAAAEIALENERLQAELRARLTELQASRARIVETGDLERQRLERNLHDGVQQQLVALSMQLRLLEDRIRDAPSEAETMAREIGDGLAHSLQELRELAHGIHPPVLDHGLAVALESLAARSPVPTAISVELGERLPKSVETAAYFVASEALANVAKHAEATAVTIRVWRSAGTATLEIVDDGVGGADDARGSGLRGLADRVEALGGSVRISSPVGSGTTIIAEMPCAS